MLSGAATSRTTAIVGPWRSTASGINAVRTARPEVGPEHHPLAIVPVGERTGDHPEDEVRQRLERTDDAHRDAGACQRKDEKRQRREADGIPER